MLKNAIIITLLLVLIYLYYQQKKQSSFITGNSSEGDELTQTKSANQTLVSFLRDQLNSNSLEELKTKLGEKSLDELLEENEDYETEVDTLTRTKNSLEQDLLAQSNGFQNRLREKDREIKKLKEDLAEEKKILENAQQNLTSEKQQHKGSLERISLLTKQVQELEVQVKKMPGEFPSETSSITSEELTNQPKLEAFIE